MTRSVRCYPAFASKEVHKTAQGALVNRIKLLIGLVLIVWLGVTVGRLVHARELAATPAAAPAPAQTQKTLPPGYVGSDTCEVCHDQATTIVRTKHGQAKDPRSPAATLGCDS